MNKRVLVLNLDHSPLTVCSVQRAFLLLYLDKAELVNQFTGLFLCTVTRSFPMPAVIKLVRYVNIPYKSVELTRQNIFKRDEFECQYCDTKNNLTLDHLVPRSKGGRSTWTNLVTACKPCNAKKGDYTLEQMGMSLKQEPFKPSYLIFLRDFSGFLSDEWVPYLHPA